ncbi:hypothetical protein [Paraburkholderia fungorum]|uniref:hypothetical protein n=1 Tax=Paraburkholderia fungorum TaxID=134537 RepID=UPI002092F273|nr:hypothetical protein [Paraburkholderia fungorum]USU21010.1 hypothetical protein NFE55_28240 [Paraburkholderia fungorum]USU26994.1 hypothetical protein NFS19_33325 [Paraburkholderia fungorum]
MVTKKTAGKKVANKKIRSVANAEKIVSPPAKYPRNAVDRSLRIPKAILEQNAGKPCSVKESASFLGVGAAGPYQVEVSSGIKYGFLERPSPGLIAVTDRAKRVLRPQDPQDRLEGLREAVLNAPVISDVYGHYRGENLPDSQFFHNALTDTFGVPVDKVAEFQDIFIESLRAAELLNETDGKLRIIDVSQGSNISGAQSPTLKKLEKAVKVDASDSCFVMMPFALPLGDYYAKIYKPAIEKAGLRPVRADAEIFGTGKIIDQIWAGINSAKVLLAELTTRNPNVFYELGLAHALEKPVVLVSSNEADIPFDLKHIRVIYYDMADPFWGGKLLDKVAENILSAIEHPEEAVLKRTL